MALAEAAETEEDAGIHRTVKLLGGKKTLRRSVRSRLDAHDLIMKGLPAPALEYLVNAVGILRAPHHRLEKAIGISVRTYQRRQEKPDQPLSPEQGGLAWTFAEVLGRAIDLFGSRAEAEEWFERPAMALDQRKPIELLSTPAGVESLQDHLTRLEYGVYT